MSAAEPLFPEPPPAPQPPPRPAYPAFTGLPDHPAILTLRARPQWVAWDYILTGGEWLEERKEFARFKWAKVPQNARTGRNASVADPDSWCTYEEAAAYAIAENLPGVGYTMSADDGLGGGDLDGVVDEAGVMEPWAAELLAKGETYAELSPSGRGVRIFGLGKPGKAHVCQPAQVEVYGTGRWLSLTGRHVLGTPAEIRPAPETFGRLIARVAEFRRLLAEEAARRREAEGKPIHDPKPRDPSKPLTFLDRVNAAAFADPEPWVTVLFGGYAAKAAAGGWRVPSHHLCRDHDEDLSLHPSGFKDFGVHDLDDARQGRRSAIDLVMEWSEVFGVMDKAPDLFGAARWLCERLGVTPESLGWKSKKERKAERRGANDVRPVISIRAGAIAENVDEMESALIQRGGLYQRGDAIVGTGLIPITVASKAETKALRVTQVGEWALAEAISSAACCMKFDARAEEEVVVNPPMPLVRTLMQRSGRLRLPPLHGIVTAPTLRLDGSVLDVPGYDQGTGLFYEPGAARFPAIPPRPTRAEAEAALATLCELIGGFPFVTGADRSVALSGFLTACVRATLPTAPLHGFSAPIRGSGKTKLGDIASVIATGRPASVVAYSGDEAEMEKRLSGLLLQGAQIATLDNATAPIDGVFLNMILSQTVATVRPLGGSKMVDVPSGTFLTVNGNGLTILGDLTRRTVVCNLDPRVERPELREFAFEPVERATAERGRLVAAALTVMLAHRAAGAPAQAQPLGSFEAWSAAVRDPLLWLGCADPLLTMAAIQEDDPEKSELDAVLIQWAEKIGEERVTVAQIIKRAEVYECAQLRADLLHISGGGSVFNSRRIGKWLGKHAKRRVNARWIEQAGLYAGNMTWQLRRA